MRAWCPVWTGRSAPRLVVRPGSPKCHKRSTGRPYTVRPMAMTTNELREAFQHFYEERAHLRVPGHSLIPPPDDQSTLFIIAGMQPFKPYFLRTKEPPSKRVVRSEEHTSELQSLRHLVCRLLLAKKKTHIL